MYTAPFPPLGDKPFIKETTLQLRFLLSLLADIAGNALSYKEINILTPVEVSCTATCTMKQNQSQCCALCAIYCVLAVTVRHYCLAPVVYRHYKMQLLDETVSWIIQMNGH